MLQFITNTNCNVPVEAQVAAALDGGCRWVQLRMKDASDDEIRRVVSVIKPMCDQMEAFLILNDRVNLAKELEVSGVHVGKEDMSPSEARAILGAGAVIGVTVNTFEDVLRAATCDIDYVGIGPYRHTTTKKNLAPILGKEGISEICRQMDEKGIEIARVAVGGIGIDDILPLMECGVNGVAVSGAIANAKDMAAATSELVRLLNSTLKN
ncbi:MAG TPA: thiamine phosphate synthase [Porphyromonadaceae bacterium]|nr:thiamine phosphate synthase [Porphyromonadaceae bacterium]